MPADGGGAILAPDGRVIDPRYIELVRAAAPRPMAREGRSPTLPWDARSGLFPYRSADLFGRDVSDWHPWIRSPDAEVNEHRDRMVARQRDLVRNDGWASGGVDRIIDNTIGAHFALISEPDWMALGYVDKRFDEKWADQFSSAVEAEWRMWADDPGCYGDAMRQQDMTAQFRLAMRHDLIDGEALGYLMWLPEFVGVYGARYATTLLVVDPDRLSNPQKTPDTATMRGGVEVDGLGAPIAYHLRRAEQNDLYDTVPSTVWDRVQRETVWKRPIVVHAFEKERATQHRGVSVLAPVVNRFRMLGKYDETELQSALVQAAIRTFIVSPFDHDQLDNAMSNMDEISSYQRERSDFHRELGTSIGGQRVSTLYPGESIQTVQDESKKDFEAFEGAVLRSIAARMGLSEGQLTQNYARTNYSSARAALLEAWKTMTRRRGTFTRRFANQIYGAWLEEALSTRLKGLLPRNAPLYPEWRTAYARCSWLGPARGWIDPVKERQGAVLGLDAAFSTLKRECAEQGLNWREVIAQRSIETKTMKDENLRLPDWAGAAPASQVDEKPQPI